MNVHLIRVNPYDPNLGVLVPIVAKRITEFAREYLQEMDPVLVTQAIMVPLWSRDPYTLVLGMVNTEGVVVGHAVGTINTDGISHWLTVNQTKADGAVGDAVKRAMQYAREWVANEINPLLAAQGKTPVSRVIIVTGRNEKAWEREFGFKLERRVMSAPLFGSETQEGEKEQ